MTEKQGWDDHVSTRTSVRYRDAVTLRYQEDEAVCLAACAAGGDTAAGAGIVINPAIKAAIKAEGNPA